MKRIISLVLVLCMCLSIAVMLAACGDEEHTHTYKTEWSKDATHHWHACEGEDCTDVADKAEHTWNEGEITTEATAEADGVKTFTCTVCGQTKTEPVEYTVNATVTKDEWETAIASTKNGLFRYSLTMGEMTGNVIFGETAIEMKTSVGASEYYVKKDTGVFHYKYDKETSAWMETSLTDGWDTTVNMAIDRYIENKEVFDFRFENFTFDDTKQMYICERMDCEDSEDYISNASFKFANGKIVQVYWEYNDVNGTEMIWYNTISCAEKDIVITLPDFNVSAPITTVTQEEWQEAFEFDCSFLQAKIFEADLSGEAEFINTEDNIRYVETYGYTQWYACYMEKVDNGWFVYEGETESGSSIEDIKSYSKEFYTFEEAAMYLFTEDVYKVYTAPFADCYEEFRYDEESQSYVADSIVLTNYHYDEKLGYADAEFSEVSISFANNRISQVCYTQTLTYSNGEIEEDTIRVEFSYDEVEIVFPVVTE